MQEAIDFEVRRQIELIEDGGNVVQETRLYDPDRHETRSMRSKEDAQDYRYFPDPDLPPLVIDDAWIARVRAAMPELPRSDEATLRAQHASAEYDAAQLTANRALAGLLRSHRDAGRRRRQARRQLGARRILGGAQQGGIDIAHPPVTAHAAWRALLKRIADGTISGKIAKDVFDAMWAGEARSRSRTRSSPRKA